MKVFVLKRLVQTLIIMVVILTLLFVLFRMMPGDPTTLMLASNISIEERDYLLAKWGLDQPYWKQYVLYFKNFIRGDFGSSFYYNKPVTEVLGDKVINSLVLMGVSILMAILVGGAAGTYCGWKRGGIIEKISIVVTLFLRSVPIYWLGIMLLSVFVFWLGWFPGSGMHSLDFSADSFWGKYFSLDFLRHLLLPGFCAFLTYLCDPLMIMRGSILEVQGEDYIELAKAKGLSDWQVMFRHGMRNAILPLITYIAILIGFAFGGQVLLETVFSWPGMGREMVLAVTRQDYPVCQAAFFLMAIVTVTMNFVVDLLYGFLDPRITYERQIR
jgi:peptide/nickel transport system permease protein